MSRKSSPAYFKSRMSTLLNPLFLGTIGTLALIAIVIWQFLGENQVANNSNLNNIPNNPNNSQIPAGFENPQLDENGNPVTAEGEVTEGQEEEEETIDPGFLSQTTSGEEILEPISRTASGQSQRPRSVRLYDQLVGLNLFPDLLPNQGGGNDPLATTAPAGSPTPPQFSSYQNQYQYRSPGSGQFAGAPTPLGQAVNTVMSNSNYSRYVAQRQGLQAQGQQAQGQVQGGVYGSNSAPVGNNLNFPNITPTLYGAPQQSFMPTYGTPSYGVPGAGGYGGVNSYGAGVSPYGGAGVGVNPYGASSFSYGGGF